MRFHSILTASIVVLLWLFSSIARAQLATEFSAHTAGARGPSDPAHIATTPDGSVWFTVIAGSGTDHIVRVTPDGTSQTFTCLRFFSRSASRPVPMEVSGFPATARISAA